MPKPLIAALLAMLLVGVFWTPSAHARGLAIMTVTTTTVDLAWTATGDDGIAGRATSYDLRYSTSPITSSNFNSATRFMGTPFPGAAGATDSTTVTGLASGTLYYFAIKAGDEVPNWSAMSNVVTATTIDAAAPAAITDLRVR